MLGKIKQMLKFFLCFILIFLHFNLHAGFLIYNDKKTFESDALNSQSALQSELKYESYTTKVIYNYNKKEWVDFFEFSEYDGLPFNIIFVTGDLIIEDLNKSEIDKFINELVDNSTNPTIFVTASDFVFSPKFYIQFSSNPFKSFYNLLASENPKTIKLSDIKKILDKQNVKNFLPDNNINFNQFYFANNRFKRIKLNANQKSLSLEKKPSNIPTLENSVTAISETDKTVSADSNTVIKTVTKIDNQNESYLIASSKYKDITKKLNILNKQFREIRSKNNDVLSEVNSSMSTINDVLTDLEDNVLYDTLELKDLLINCGNACSIFDANFLMDEIKNLKNSLYSLEDTLYASKMSILTLLSEKENNKKIVNNPSVPALPKLTVEPNRSIKETANAKPQLSFVPKSYIITNLEKNEIRNLYFTDFLLNYYDDYEINFKLHLKDLKKKIKSLNKNKSRGKSTNYFKKTL